MTPATEPGTDAVSSQRRPGIAAGSALDTEVPLIRRSRDGSTDRGGEPPENGAERKNGAPMAERDDSAGRVEERLKRLKEAVAALSTEVRTRRLVVTDDEGRDRIVGEVVDGVTELRLDLPGRAAGRGTAVLVFANPGSERLGPGIGVQLWHEGDCVDELSVWPDRGR